GSPGLDVRSGDTLEAAPVPQPLGDQLGHVVATDIGRCASPLDELLVTDTVQSALIERAGKLAKHSRVNSSVTLRILIGLSSLVSSNSKSMAHT
ncbi:MAG: hypothetical protein ABSC73_08550, partial [Acidimicrobiales bacterium]